MAKENSVYASLLNIQRDLKAPKGQVNSFGGYKYRSAEDILEAVKPLLAQEGVILTLNDDIIAVGDRVYVKATATLTDIVNGGTVETSAMAREASIKKGMDDSQITGTASSYARKYALNGLFCIDDTKDADTDEYAKKQMGEGAKKAALMKSLNGKIKSLKLTKDEVSAIAGVKFGKTSAMELTLIELQDMDKNLQSYVDEYRHGK